MNFETFSVATTTIFPIANSKVGGQLATEWNLRSRDFVSSQADITYDIAHSYVHGYNDFDVRAQQDDTGVILSNSTLEILPGTAILNGHYVKQDAYMIVDLLEANSELEKAGLDPLQGKLAVGLRVYYSTEATMVGSLVAENDQDVYEGVQVVVLPESQLKTPEDSPTNQSLVTCNLKLATFSFIDNVIRSISNNEDKIKYLEAERIDNIDSILDDTYVTYTGLNPKKLYTMAGKGPKISTSTWCDSTDSLMIWDKNPTRTTTKPTYDVAQFLSKTDSEEVTLHIPHKQIDGMVVSTDEDNDQYNVKEYYKSVELDLPLADFSTNTSGTVGASYTKRIKDISRKVDDYFELIKGKQVAYIEQLDDLDELPPINTNWDPGDYTLVNLDNVAMTAEEDIVYTRAPSTLYAILPGQVKSIKYAGKSNSLSEIPSALTGVQIGTTVESDEAPVTTVSVTSNETEVVASIGQTNILEGSVTYTTSEGIVYEDNGEGELIYSEDNQSDTSEANLPIMLSEFSQDSTQCFTLSLVEMEDDTENTTIYNIISSDGKYLTALEDDYHKVYLASEATDYSQFTFYDPDNLNNPLELNLENGTTLSSVEIACNAITYTSSGNTEYGRLTASEASEGVVPYVYITNNVDKDSDRQLWSIIIDNNSIYLYSPWAEAAVTEVTYDLLTSTEYEINYEAGTISTDNSIGTVSYSYQSEADISTLLNYFAIDSEVRGVIDVDYFVYKYTDSNNVITYYFYKVSEEGTREWSDAIWISGTIGLATETTVGGFLNVPEEATDGGYVWLNDDGYLQLLDYDLLRTGAAAYQLGEDKTIDSESTAEEIQDYLDEYVNERVAFPNSSQISTITSNTSATGIYSHPEVINIYIPITAEDEETVISIYDIDSRFGSSVCVHITGDANSNNTIIFKNIEKLMIDNSIQYDESDPPVIQIQNCCLYYDSYILNIIAKSNSSNDETGISGISFWYEQYEETDPVLNVNDMTISELDAPTITDIIDFWNSTSTNDNHYHVALHSITFGDDGTICEAKILIANDSTSNLQTGHYITAGEFELPQGNGLNYPYRLMTHQLKFTGTFESGYQSDSGYVIQDTKFSALTQEYNLYSNSDYVNGSILFHIDTNIIDTDFGGVSTEAWETDTYHVFNGVAL